MTNRLYYGDNLAVLRDSIPDESVDLIYLDPPFNSNASYNVLFKAPSGEQSQAQIEAFDDTWHWNESAERAFDEVLTGQHSDAAIMLKAMRSALGENDMMAYLAHNSAKRWGPIHDTIFFYTNSDEYVWNRVFQPYDPAYVDRYFKFDDQDGRGNYWTGDLTGAGTRQGPSGEPWRGFDVRAKGRHWAYSPEQLERLDLERRIYWPASSAAMPKLKRYLSEAKGIPAQDVLMDVPSLQRMSAAYEESLGHPTQKPVALLERIICASSNEGDVVLDPFCGCGTTVHAAQKLNRQWIGIDVTHLAIALIERRLKAAFPGIAYEVHGVPKDVAGARDLAERDKHEFQKWITATIGGQPYKGGKKGMDRGIDGYLHFRDADKKQQFAIISVKGGGIKSGDIRDLKGALEREKRRPWSIPHAQSTDARNGEGSGVGRLL